MAVSMNSGFMRSDFMISDAALPLRIEELEQLEQTAKFAEILNGFDSSTKQPVEADTAAVEAAEVPVEADVPAEALTTAQDSKAEITVEIPKSEIKKLATAVVKGEVKLDELPEALVSDALLMAIAMIMLGNPEQELTEEQSVTFTVTEVEAEAMSEFVATVRVPVKKADSTEIPMATSETAPQTEIPDELMAEVRSVIDRIVRTEEQLPDAQAVPQHTVQAEAVETVKAEITEIPSEKQDVTKQTADDNADVQVNVAATAEVQQDVAMTQPTVQQQTAEPTTQVQAQQTAEPTAQVQPQQKSAPTVQVQQTAKTSQPQQDISEELEQLKQIISQVTVKKTEAQQPVQQSYTAQVYSADEQARGRLVVKTDELAMLKSAKTVDENTTAQAKLTALTAEGDTEIPVTAVLSDSGKGVQTEVNPDTQQAAMMAAQQTAAPEAPVVIQRADGTEVVIRPDEVVRQVIDNVVQQTETVEGDTEYSMTLNPEDLGSITVRMTKTADGTFTVSITAENARTQRIIEENGFALQNSLRQNGIELENWQTVTESEQRSRAEDYNGSSKNPYYHEEQSENDDAEDTSFAEIISAM